MAEDPSSAALWEICEMSVVMEGVMVMMVAEVFIVFFFREVAVKQRAGLFDIWSEFPLYMTSKKKHVLLPVRQPILN